MAVITEKAKLDIQIRFAIDEEEARALDALVGYGDDEFIKWFYEFLGKSYMEKHEQGLRKFMSSVREFLPPILSKLDEHKKIYSKK